MLAGLLNSDPVRPRGETSIGAIPAHAWDLSLRLADEPLQGSGSLPLSILQEAVITTQNRTIRQEKRAQAQTLGVGYLLVGWGSSTGRGGDQKVWYVLNFLTGYPDDCGWDILGLPEKFEKKFVFNSEFLYSVTYRIAGNSLIMHFQVL